MNKWKKILFSEDDIWSCIVKITHGKIMEFEWEIILSTVFVRSLTNRFLFVSESSYESYEILSRQNHMRNKQFNNESDLKEVCFPQNFSVVK